MKKKLLYILIFIMFFCITLTGCGKQEESQPKTNGSQETANEEPENYDYNEEEESGFGYEEEESGFEYEEDDDYAQANLENELYTESSEGEEN